QSGNSEKKRYLEVDQLAIFFELKSRKFSVIKEYFTDTNFQDKKYITNGCRYGRMELIACKAALDG
ncbi:hypothetical protein M8C21_009687, partial [Ambrosia artemisiifolia]